MATFWTVVVTVLVLVCFILLLFLLPDRAYGDEAARVFSEVPIAPKVRVHVVVLGDIARSPRMRNHALSFARHGIPVDLIGYAESELPDEIKKEPLISVRDLGAPPSVLQTSRRSLFVIVGPLKVLAQVWALYRMLAMRLEPAKWILVQNPPSIPTLFIAAMVAFLRKSRFVIDWHNYGYSILALKLGKNHPMVRASYLYEAVLSRAAHLNYTVSDAMSRQLKRDFGIKAPVVALHDRPTADFKPISAEERQTFLEDLVPPARQKAFDNGSLRVLVSSTSWTPDEDFSVLLTALVQYAALDATKKGKLPELLVVITGKGPQKAMYLRRIRDLEASGALDKVTIQTIWFPSISHYAQMLACADVGISMHQSSSGVDLPMKVVDMLGAGLPIVGWSAYESWNELVQDSRNGRGFTSSEELVSVLSTLFGNDGTKLRQLRQGALQEGSRRWDQTWDELAAPAFGIKTA